MVATHHAIIVAEPSRTSEEARTESTYRELGR